MKIFLNFFRILHIYYVLIKHDLSEWVSILIPGKFRFLSFLFWFPERLFFNQSNGLSSISFRPNKKPRGQRIREALQELGPIFVKFGQVLSTRFDILPEDILEELTKLQDQVPPFPGELARSIVETALNQKIETVFLKFDHKALASASIAQVHAAQLLDGREVVVKVLRPKVKKSIEQDVALLKTLSHFCHRYWKASRQFKPKEIVAEFEKSLEWELDLIREAASASQLRRNFKNSPMLYVPEIYWPYTKNNILVQERIYGIPLSNLAEIQAQGFDLKQLAERGVELFFTQVFRDCFFHADMHPGNILVSRENILEPQFIAVDFGIMGSLNPRDQRYLAENFLAFFKRDYRRVAELHLESGWISPKVRLDEFEASIRTVCEPIFERPIKEISFGKMLFNLFQAAKEFKIDIQPQLILLQKTLMNVEGLGRRLYPDLDLWHTAKPFLENWMKTQVGPRALIRKLKTYGPYWLEKLPELPDLIHRVLSQESAGKLLNPPTIESAESHWMWKIVSSKAPWLFAMLAGMGTMMIWVWQTIGCK